MFPSLVSLRSTTRSCIALAGASLAALAAAAPMMGAGPWDLRCSPWGKEIELRVEPRQDYRHNQRPEYRPQVFAPADVAPCDLNITAFQSRSTIMIFATGTNRSGGFCTSFCSLDSRDSAPRIQLHNTAPSGYANQCISPFSINAALHTDRCVSKIEILVGDHFICIPVQEVPGIS